MRRHILVSLFATAGLAGCATTVQQQGTLAELSDVPADIEEVQLEDGLERAEQSYRRYLAETSASARTPEAMRRLADLQIEQEYGVIGGGGVTGAGDSGLVEMAAPKSALPVAQADTPAATTGSAEPTESEQDFERRASDRQELLSTSMGTDEPLPVGSEPVPAGPREAIETYRKILETYPNYERNDQVVYQMSRAYDEIGQPDEAMEVMDQLVARYPYSKYVDEVHFRRGEYQEEIPRCRRCLRCRGPHGEHIYVL
jgi:tetratricopeptide (TPR) repeat protein